MPATDDVIISPSKTPGDAALPATGLFFVNPFEAAYASTLARKRDFSPFPLFNSHLHVSPPDAPPLFVCGPAVGAPMAALTLEKLIACGAREIVLMGWCGGLQKHMRVGDTVIPDGAVSEEGTSRHYPSAFPLAPEASLADRLALFFERQGQTPLRGFLWSTDAPYRETLAKVQRYHEDGILGVDMEFAALCAVASFRDVSLAAVMLVSDLLSASVQWKPGFTGKAFKKKSRQLVDMLFSFC